MKFSDIQVRNARLDDVAALKEIIDYYSQQNLLLPKTSEEIIDKIRNFFVAVLGDLVVGCCAIAFFSSDLAEIRSVAVRMEFQRHQLGQKLIEHAESVLRDEHVCNAFVLTRAKNFFLSLGYLEVSKMRFPQKIWKDCLTCPNLMKCDEIAMLKIL